LIREQHLDFIRGFAIICVLIYHLDINFSNFKVFSGGYLGVDIFFVLSGYLITKISIEKKRNILKNISSRLRRLLPALLLMILITIIYASIFYMPQNLINVSYSSIFSSLFLSNLYFYRSIQIYGDESQFSSLIHTWSLSVEMQIYIFFFISLFFFNKKSHFKIYIIIVFFLSLLITFFLYDERKLFSFYSPVTRLI
jgi:peptidoglycan/LPS O-acetylase OafA/YrhL